MESARLRAAAMDGDPARGGGGQPRMRWIMVDYIRSGNSMREGDTERRRILRTGARPLVGVVTLLGIGSVAGTGTTLYVRIYRRQRGGYVVAHEHLTIWQGHDHEYRAVLCQSPQSVLTELGGDEMRPAEDEAWSRAVERDEALRAISEVEI